MGHTDMRCDTAQGFKVQNGFNVFGCFIVVSSLFATSTILNDVSASAKYQSAPGSVVGSNPKSTDDATKSQALENYGKLPLYFIQNDGQMDGKVKFYEKGSGHATFFTKRGVYLSLVGGRTNVPLVNKHYCKEQDDEAGPKSETQNSEPSTHNSSTPQLVKLLPLGANKNPEIIAEGQQDGKVNYFIGSDPKKWKTNIPTYKSVVYKDIYKDIDMKFYGNNRQMEYDIIVKPGASPSRVQLTYDGIEDLRVNEQGDLEILLNSPLKRGAGGVSELSQQKPANGKQPPESPFFKGDLREFPFVKENFWESTFAKGNLRLGGMDFVVSAQWNDKRSLSVLPAGGETPNHGNDGSVSTLPRRLAKRTQQNVLSIGTEKAGETKERTIIQKKPYVYQIIDGKKIEIEGRFKIRNPKSEISNSNLKSKIVNHKFIYGFTVASYDKRYPLVIDPVIAYSTYLGGGVIS